MEGERNENQIQPGERNENQIQPAQAPLQCPRCNSMDTKFRYFNNHDLAQPRHYCRNCKRLWTVGGSLRDIPVGGNSRNKPNRRHGGEASAQPQPQPQPPLFPSMVPQNLDVSLIPPATNMPQHTAPLTSYYLTHEFPNVGAIDSLIQHDVVNQTANVGGANRSFLQDWNIQSTAQALPQLTPGNPGMIDLNQPHGQIGSYGVPNYGLIRSDWPMNFSTQETMNNFSVSTSDARSRGSFSGNTTNMPTTSANPNDSSTSKTMDNHGKFM